MNIANIGLDTKITVELKHPNTGVQLFNADKTKMTIDFSGVRSAKYQEKATEIRKASNIEDLLKKARADKATDEDKIAYLDKANEVIKESAISCIESVNIDSQNEGEKITVAELVEWLGKDSHKWIADQILDCARRGEDFIKA